ncbi:hypothetical protein EDF52_106284 [Curtobacterium sp. PhB42]|nr:hypothetical protein EDF52_106284 [Curtobacterium sp. PhB42]TDW49202.1 hypothetical protein EDF47_1191 [Curtobacterium sp. PhB190]
MKPCSAKTRARSTSTLPLEPAITSTASPDASSGTNRTPSGAVIGICCTVSYWPRPWFTTLETCPYSFGIKAQPRTHAARSPECLRLPTASGATACSTLLTLIGCCVRTSRPQLSIGIRRRSNRTATTQRFIREHDPGSELTRRPCSQCASGTSTSSTGTASPGSSFAPPHRGASHTRTKYRSSRHRWTSPTTGRSDRPSSGSAIETLLRPIQGVKKARSAALICEGPPLFQGPSCAPLHSTAQNGVVCDEGGGGGGGSHLAWCGITWDLQDRSGSCPCEMAQAAITPVAARRMLARREYVRIKTVP